MEEAMAPERYVLGLFPSEETILSTIKAMAGRPWKIDRVHSPFPSHRILEALKVKKSPVGWFTLAGGILGFLTGVGLAVYTASEWKLVVWGKPILAWIPFVIVGFEFTILFSVFANVLGLIVLGGLPDLKGLKRYDPRCSGEHFGIVAACPRTEENQLMEFFRDNGGEVRVFDERLAS